MKLGERVAEARKVAGLTPAEFARRVGVTQPAIWKIETGQTKALKATTAMAMEAATGFCARWLSDGVGPKLCAEAANEIAREYESSLFSKLSAEEKARVVMQLLPELGEDDRLAALRFLIGRDPG